MVNPFFPVGRLHLGDRPVPHSAASATIVLMP